MAYQVTLDPGGRRFVAYERETILDAALRAGLNMKYRCNNGACGECAARLTSGEVAQCGHSDFCFSEARKNDGYFLPCRHAARGDIVIEADVYAQAAEVPTQVITAKVKKVVAASEDIRLLQLRTPRSRALQFLAGQHAALRLGESVECSLAIASCPCNGMLLEFHVRRDETAFCDYVFTRLGAGEEVEVTGPSGDWTLDEESRRPLLFVAFDTGFAGVKSLLEHAFALDMPQDMCLYRVAYAGDDYLQNLCRAWSDALDNFRYYSARCDAAADARTIADDIAARATVCGVNVGQTDAYLAGPRSVTRDIGAALIARGLPPARLFIQ